MDPATKPKIIEGLKQKLLDKDSYFAILLDNDTNGKEPVIGQIIEVSWNQRGYKQKNVASG